MDEFIDRLPVRIAALAGLLVGAVSLYRGASVFGALERVLAAMAVFGVLGAFMRLLIKQSTLEQTYQVEHRGRHLDAVTPGMTVEDLARGKHGRKGDQGELS